MAVAKCLPETDPFFVQNCPMCFTPQRMMIRGLYVDPKTKEGKLYPDMGYSFCNCRDIFFTKRENITIKDGGFNSSHHPIAKLKHVFSKCEEGKAIVITMRDPYFIHWTRPHEYTGFNPRVNYILWDMGSWVKECLAVGFELVSAVRDMDVNSKTPECYHVTLRKP